MILSRWKLGSCSTGFVGTVTLPRVFYGIVVVCKHYNKLTLYCMIPVFRFLPVRLFKVLSLQFYLSDFKHLSLKNVNEPCKITIYNIYHFMLSSHFIYPDVAYSSHFKTVEKCLMLQTSAAVTFTVYSVMLVRQNIEYTDISLSVKPIIWRSRESKLNRYNAPAEKLNLPICRKTRWQETSQFATCAAHNKPQPCSPASWEVIIPKKECHAVLRCSRIKTRETASLQVIMRELETSFN